jgi:hypothetical protein
MAKTHPIGGNGRAGFCEWCGEPKVWCEECEKWGCEFCDGLRFKHQPQHVFRRAALDRASASAPTTEKT